MQIDPQAVAILLENQLSPWKQAILDPAKTQENVLHHLLCDYAKTNYGSQHGAAEVSSITEFRERFPIITYASIQPLIQRVMQGETELLLWEPPIGWAITRGTTKEIGRAHV